MKQRPICEPVELGPGAAVMVDHVSFGSGSAAAGWLAHFHDVSELVLFEDVAGWFSVDGRRYSLEAGSIAFIPSMRHHDFGLDAGEKSWWLVQIDPSLVEQLVTRSNIANLSQPFCVWAKRDDFERFRVLANWLGEAAARDPTDLLVVRIVELLLTATGQQPAARDETFDGNGSGVERLWPVIERLQRDPAAAISLSEAATACNLSPAYFSRLFKRIFATNFSDYVRAHRLRIAARWLRTTRKPISRIAYDIGFSSPSHFTRLFREQFEISPREYRRGS